MQTINLEEARNLAIKTLKTLKDEAQGDFLLLHSEKVGLTADLVASVLGLESESYKIAGWLHDIGYVVSMEDHGIHSLEILRDKNIELDLVTKDCIMHHGGDGEPETREGQIFQLADKLSVYDLDTIKIFLKHGGLPLPDDYLNLLKMLSDGAVSLLSDFKKI